MGASRPRQLLLADDLSIGAQTVRDVSVSLARALDTAISLVYVEDLKSHPGGRPRFQEFARLHESIKLKIAAAARAMPVPVDCLIRFGSPAEEILRLASSRPFPELVVMGTHGRRGLNRVLVGSVAEEVLRHCVRPVLSVGPRASEAPRFEPARRKAPVRLLVATELGRNSRAAEQYALSLARRLGAGMLLYHCLWDRYRTIQESVLNSGAMVLDLEETLSEIRANAIAALRAKAAFFESKGIACEWKLEERPILSALAVPEEAQKGFVLIVMGTHGRNALLNAFFGSTAREAVLNAEVPVITVRSR